MSDVRTKAVVVREHVPKALLADRFAGWKVIYPGDELAPHAFERIVCMFAPHFLPARRAAETKWVAHTLSNAILPGRKLEWVS
jgi:hypothetical protein